MLSQSELKASVRTSGVSGLGYYRLPGFTKKLLKSSWAPGSGLRAAVSSPLNGSPAP